MKKMFTILVAVLLTNVNVQAQDNTSAANGAPETNCYLKWAKLFEERGAYDVEDGSYSDVIITFRNGSAADCFNGKVDVKEGKIIAMFLKFEDNSVEPIKRKWKYEIKDVTVINGISKTLLTVDDELINVMFVKKLKPKKKAYVSAPDPEVEQ